MTNDITEWEGDVLNRKKYSVFLTKHLESKKEPFVININATWGAGKTFFLNKWFEDVKQNHPAIYFNAWENDYSDDPLIAIISCINQSLTPLLVNKENTRKVLESSVKMLTKLSPILIKGIVNKAIGDGGFDALKEINNEDESSLTDLSSKITEELLSSHENTSKSIAQFQASITECIKKIARKNNSLTTPLFVFIDELDRCRPLYSIELLERVKHIFNIPDVVFVVATDTQQLSHSVKAIYGEGFNGETYLRRFFDQIYTLPKPDYIEFSSLIFEGFKPNVIYFDYGIIDSKAKVHTQHRELINEHTLFCDPANINYERILLFSLFATYFGLDLRTMKQCFDRFTAIENSLSTREHIHFGYLIFLIMFEANNSQNINKFFDLSQRKKRFTVFEGFGQAKQNLIFSNKAFTALQLIHLYVKLTECTHKELENHLTRPGAAMDVLENNLALHLFENPCILNNYIELVEMAEALN